MELMKAYRSLQLNPANVRQMTAFEALCWQLIQRHADLNWIQQVQDLALPLDWITEHHRGQVAKQSQITYTMHDDTLELLTHEFMRKYAKKIWPWERNLRAHLLDTRDTELKATGVQMRARTNHIARLEAARHVRSSERMYVVESKIGRLVREYLKLLLTWRYIPRYIHDSPQHLLAIFLGRVQTLDWPCMRIGCSAVCSSTTTLAIHEDVHRLQEDEYEDEDLDEDHVHNEKHVQVQVQVQTQVQTQVHDEEQTQTQVQAQVQDQDQVQDDDEDDDEDDDIEVILPSGPVEKQTTTVAPSHPEVTPERFSCPHPGYSRVFTSREALFTHTSLPHDTIFRNATLSQPSPKNIERPGQSPKSAEGELHDSVQEVLGLGCTKPGCGRRFLKFSLLEAHEQQHEKDSPAGGIGTMPELNLTSGRDVHVDNNEKLVAEAQQESTGVQSVPDTNHLWGELFGEED